MEVSFKLKNCLQETMFSLGEGRDGLSLQELGGDKDGIYIPLKIDDDDTTFEVRQGDAADVFEDDQNIVKERLANLYREWKESQNIGFDASTGSTISYTQKVMGYSHENIYVENKPFSIWQLIDYIDKQILIVNPDFQRNFIWDIGRQSRLIESILLGLPLPSIYLSQFEDGTLAVVDGLQRISSINAFMKNKLRLCGLEYLTNCEGHTYAELKNILPPLVYRMFDQTTIMCFVIDRRSPYQLKYDLFKRLNTGGVPLNNQEIRNCLSKEPLQKALKRMVESEAFRQATGDSINNYRMDAQEMALRFIYFYDEYSTKNVIGEYNGYLDYALNKKVEELNQKTDFSAYEKAFERALTQAYSLFGWYTFRKVLPDDSRRRRVNKSLFVAISVILAKDGDKYVASKEHLVDALANLLNEDAQLFNAITWSTTSVSNTLYVMNSIQNLFNEQIGNGEH